MRFNFNITDDNGEIVAQGSTYIIPNDIQADGSCESVDLEVSSYLRSLRKRNLMNRITHNERDWRDMDDSESVEHRAEEQLFRKRESNIKD